MDKSRRRIQRIIVQVIFLISVAIIWEVTAKAHVFGERSELVFPTLEAIGTAFIRNFTEGYANVSFWVYIFYRLNFKGQIWNSLFNYVVFFVAVPTLARVKPLKIHIN